MSNTKSLAWLYNHMFLICCLLLGLMLAVLLLSCSVPLGQRQPAGTATKNNDELVGEGEPKPGDVKIVDGVEYIYARNRRFQLTPHEPEYLWLRKDEYSPGIFESVMEGNKKERQELERRMAKLEAQLKNGNPPPEVPRPENHSPTAPPLLSARYASPVPQSRPRTDLKLKRRVLILPDVPDGNDNDLRFDELVMRKMGSFLEQAGVAVSVDPAAVKLTRDLPVSEAMELLELSGIHAVINTFLTGVRGVSTTSGEGTGRTLKLSVRVYSTETRALLREVSAHAPIRKDTGNGADDHAVAEAIDIAVDRVGNDLVKSLQSLDWHTRVASVELGRIILNAGRSSGLEKGDVLEVYAAGDQVFDKATHMPLGRIKGGYKGEIEVSELFGVDAAAARIRKGAAFTTTDLAYPRK